MERNSAIDIAKAIAIILMLIGHCETLNFYVLKLIFSFHMPLFFVFSGYFYKPKDGVVLIKNDFKKLLIPYIITILVGALICFILYSPVSFFNIIEGAFVGCTGRMGTIIRYSEKQAGPIWFLLSLFWCRSYFNFLYKRCEKYKLVIICIILFIFFWLFDMKVMNIPLCIGNAFTVMLFYMIGFQIRYIGIEKIVPNSPHIIIGYLLWWGAAVYYGSMNLAQYTYSMGPGIIHHIFSFLLGIPAAIIGTLFVYKLSQYFRGIWKHIFMFIGNHTLEILCCHTLAYYLRQYLLTLFGYDKNNITLKDFFLVAISILLSILYIGLKQYLKSSVSTRWRY